MSPLAPSLPHREALPTLKTSNPSPGRGIVIYSDSTVHLKTGAPTRLGLTKMLSLATLVAGLVTGLVATGQTVEENARINYEAAKLALAQEQPAVALHKFEEVLSVLGETPELLYYAAEAAFAAGDYGKARHFKQRCFSAADSPFRESETYKKLLQLSARLELLSDPAVLRRELEDRSRKELERRGLKVDAAGLRTAAGNSDLALVKLFLAGGVRPDKFAAYVYSSVSKQELLQVLLESGAGVDPDDLCNYIGKGQLYLSVIQALIKSGASVNSYCFDTEPLLVRFCGHYTWAPGIAILLEHGAKINAQDSLGATAIWVSAKQCRTENVEALLKGGADPRIPDRNYKKTPLKIAREYDDKSPGCKATIALLEAHK